MWETKFTSATQYNSVLKKQYGQLSMCKFLSWTPLWFPSVETMLLGKLKFLQFKGVYVGFGGLRVTWSPWDPRFVGSNPAGVNGFSEHKNPEHKSSGRDFKPGVPSLRFQAH